MGQAIDTALVLIIGCVNQMVFSASRGRVVLYRFRGRPTVRLTMTRPGAPHGETVSVGYLADGDDYIVLGTEAQGGLLTALRTATVVSAEIDSRQIPVGITIVTDEAARADLINRLFNHASIDERHDVTRRREVALARLTPRGKRGVRNREGFTGISRP